MTSKKAFTVWILVVLAFLSVLGMIHAWISWQAEGWGFMVTILPLASSVLQMEAATYFASTLTMTLLFTGALCFTVFQSNSLDLALLKLSRDLQEELNVKTQEIKDLTDKALTNFELREFQLKERMKAFHYDLENMNEKVKESLEQSEMISRANEKKLMAIEGKIDKIQTAQKELPKFKKKLETIKTLEKKLTKVQRVLEKIDSVPEPALSSIDKIRILQGKVLRKGTVRRLTAKGIVKLEDLLLKSPVEIAQTKTMSETEAKRLQSVIQLLMVPGIQHEDAVLLLDSGVFSKRELALQDVFSLGARVSRVADRFITEGKIKSAEKPTLEKVSAWIKWAKTE